MNLDQLVDAPAPRPVAPPPVGPRRPSGRARVAGFVALCVACVSVSVAYLTHAERRDRRDVPAVDPEVAAAGLEGVVAQPHVVFRTLAAGQAGLVAVAPAADPDGPRALTELDCLRVYMAAGSGMCLTEKGGTFTPYSVVFFGPDFRPRGQESLAGLMSRARVSPDGRYGTATVFVTGHSYAPGTFSTQTTIHDMATGELLGELESFTVEKDGKEIKAADFNFWGVTFAREPGIFYATLGTAGHTYLVRGDVESARMEVLRDGVECPSLSPDGTRIAFKQRTGSGLGPVTWRPAVLDVATLADHPLSEDRTVDDQIEWLNDDTVLYAVDTGVGAPDTWAASADGTGEPRLFLTDADSPAVVRG
ncbi:MAG: hypothetical protein ACRD0C_02915 [Acidimicrobiia bacterium]